MAIKNPLSEWYAREINHLDINYEDFKTTFEIIFAVAIAIAFTLLPMLPKGVDLTMTWQYWFMTIFIWVSVFCAIYLIRNSRKHKDKTNILLEAIAKKMGVDIDALDKHPNGDKNGENKPKT
jgi:hypothetical protein